MVTRKISLIFNFVFICFLNISCSNLSRNSINQGLFKLPNGVYRDQTWNTDLVFKRTSWYSEVNLYFDVLLADLPKDSPFFQWVGKNEIPLLNSCSEYYLVLVYAFDSEKISERLFLDQMNNQQFLQILLPDFSREIRLHPDFNRLGLTPYKTYFLCNKKEKKISPELNVRFPGFLQTTIN